MEDFPPFKYRSVFFVSSMNFISFLNDEGEDRQAVGFVKGRLQGSVPENTKTLFFI